MLLLLVRSLASDTRFTGGRNFPDSRVFYHIFFPFSRSHPLHLPHGTPANPQPPAGANHDAPPSRSRRRDGSSLRSAMMARISRGEACFAPTGRPDYGGNLLAWPNSVSIGDTRGDGKTPSPRVQLGQGVIILVPERGNPIPVGPFPAVPRRHKNATVPAIVPPPPSAQQNALYIWGPFPLPGGNTPFCHFAPPCHFERSVMSFRAQREIFPRAWKTRRVNAAAVAHTPRLPPALGKPTGFLRAARVEMTAWYGPSRAIPAVPRPGVHASTPCPMTGGTAWRAGRTAMPRAPLPGDDR